MGSCAAPSAKGDDKFITTDYLQQCLPDNISASASSLRRFLRLSCQSAERFTRSDSCARDTLMARLT
ncbi:hypothetical protein, partial [Raoultella planticola]|uniref:hypothetical protein n=1 Tax=Raoultella planticola TaxID=575 RepID=UPI000FEB88BE